MKAITFAGERAVRVASVPDPTVEAPTDAVVAVRLTAVCGSDLHVYRGHERGLDPGTVMGHEMVAEVVETGGEVATLRPGDRVACPFTTSCGRCFYCAQGLTCRCGSGQLFGWVERGEGLPGTQAERVRVPLADSTLVKLPESVSDEEGLLLGDVLPTGAFCAELAGVDASGVYAVVGCGPVGLMAVAASRHRGAPLIVAIDSIAERLELARRLGARPLDYRERSPVEVLRELTEGRGADAVLEVVGTASATRTAVELVRPGGVVASVGVHTEQGFAFDLIDAYNKNLTYRTGRCPARHLMEDLLPLLADGRLAPSAVVSHRMPLEEGARAYELFDAKREGCIKALLVP